MPRERIPDDCDASFAAKECRRGAPSCDDGVDNDCDGAVDGDDPDCWYCGDGVLQAGVMTPGACLDHSGTSVGEECDDGNENGLDGCAVCVIVDTPPD